MSNETNSSNFIKNIIINDLETGKHDSIITRFPPEPNGYLHIGHEKSICLRSFITLSKCQRDCEGSFIC